MATEKIALQVDVNTGKAVSNLGKLEKATKSVATTTKTAKKETLTLEQQFKNLNKQIKEEPVNIRAMNKQIQQYQAIALEAGRTSPLGREAIQKAAALKDKYVDIQNEVNRLANDGVKLKAALDLGSTVVAGFAGFQGIMALSGSKSEDLRKAMMKLQGAMALLMAVETIRKNLEKESTLVLVAKQTVEKAGLILTKATTAAQTMLGRSTDATTKSFKLMRGALIATGIGALVVLIGTLIAKWDDITAALGSATAEQKAYNEATTKAIEGISKELSAADKLQKVLNDETISREEKNKAVKELQKEYPNLLSNVDAEKNSIEEINKALELNTKLLLLKAKQEAVAQLRAEEFKKIIQAQTDAQTGANVGILEQAKAWAIWLHPLSDSIDAQDLANHKTAQSIKVNQKQVTALDNVEAALQKEIDALKELGAVGEEEATAEVVRNKTVSDKKVDAEKEKQQGIKDVDEKATAAKKKAEEKAAADEIKREDKQWKLLQEVTSTRQELELFKLSEKYDKRFELAEGNAELEKALEEQKNIDLAAIDKKYADKEAAIAAAKKAAEDAAKDKEEEDAEEKRQQELDDMTAKLDSATAFLDSLQTLNNLAAGKSEAQQRKAFERNKKIQSAQAMISAAKGVVNIIGQESLLPQPMDGIYKGVQIAVLAATLGLQLKKINSAKFGGGGSGVTTPSLSGGGGGSVPTLNPVSNTNTVLGQENKVYVTETDISNTQNKVKVIEERATF
jgi:hypothetical protein